MKKILFLSMILSFCVFGTMKLNAAAEVTIYKGTAAIVSVTELVTHLPAEVSRVVELDNYTGKGHIPGKYTIRMEDDYSFTINVVEELDTLWVKVQGDNVQIFILSDRLLTQNDYVIIFKALGRISKTATQINLVIVDDLYQARPDAVGSYDGSFSITTNAGDASSGLLTITVSLKSGIDINNPGRNLNFLQWLIPLGVALAIMIGFVSYKNKR